MTDPSSILVACPQCRREVAIAAGNNDNQTCPHCGAQLAITAGPASAAGLMEAFILYIATGAIWAAVVLPQGGKPYSPLIALGASLFSLLVTFAAIIVWRRRALEPGPLRSGILVFGTMTVSAAAFALLDAILNSQGGPLLLAQPISFILGLQAWMATYLPGETFEVWALSVAAGLVVLSAIFLLLRRSKAAIALAKGSTRAAGLFGAIGVTLAAFTSFSIVALPAGARFIATQTSLLLKLTSS
jgi:hypothetical protein